MQVRGFLKEAGDCGPLVAHCSAGVGRAGSFVTVDVQLEKYANEKQLDVFAGWSLHVLNHFFALSKLIIHISAALSILRQFRCKLVQTSAQYVFIYQVLIDAISQLVSDSSFVLPWFA